MHPEPILKVRLEFRVRPGELHELRSVLLSFAAEERLTVNDVGTRIPPKQERPLFHIELEQGASVQVVVTNIRAEERMFVWVYELQPGSRFEQLGSRLQEVLRRKWPTLAPYDGS